MKRKTKNSIGIVYLLTSSLYEKENTYKYGITTNPRERKRTQENSTPPTHPFYYPIVLFSSDYKQIEKYLEKRFKEEGFLLYGDGGTEWIKAEVNDIFKIYEEALKLFPKSEMCFEGRRFRFRNGVIEKCKLPNCRLDMLGINDDDEVTCILDGRKFKVKDNKIMAGDTHISLTRYINEQYRRNGKTNEHNGYQYFKYKGNLISEMWRDLVGKETERDQAAF